MKTLKAVLLGAALVMSTGAIANEPRLTDDTWFCNDYNELMKSYNVFTMKSKTRQDYYFDILYDQTSCTMANDGIEYFVTNSRHMPFVEVELWIDGEPHKGWTFSKVAYTLFTVDPMEYFVE